MTMRDLVEEFITLQISPLGLKWPKGLFVDSTPSEPKEIPSEVKLTPEEAVKATQHVMGSPTVNERSRRLALIGSWARYNRVWIWLRAGEAPMLPELPNPTPFEGGSKRKRMDDDEEQQGSSPQCQQGPTGPGELSEPPPVALTAEALGVRPMPSPSPAPKEAPLSADQGSEPVAPSVHPEIDWGDLFVPSDCPDLSPVIGEVPDATANDEADLGVDQDEAIEVADKAERSSSSSEQGIGESHEGSSDDDNDEEGAGDDVAHTAPSSEGVEIVDRSATPKGATSRLPLLRPFI
ncbi:hypothetical protein ABZP36_007189 [Zizania latifolia]